jgi:hypothetical protein
MIDKQTDAELNPKRLLVLREGQVKLFRKHTHLFFIRVNEA